MRDDNPVLHAAAGRGPESLRLVAALSGHLGRYQQTTDPASKVVWFTMPVTPQAQSSKSRSPERG